jgi:nicotinamidase-related amidase
MTTTVDIGTSSTTGLEEKSFALLGMAYRAWSWLAERSESGTDPPGPYRRRSSPAESVSSAIGESAYGPWLLTTEKMIEESIPNSANEHFNVGAPMMRGLTIAVAVTAAFGFPCNVLTAEDALLVVDVQNDFLEARPASNRSSDGPHEPVYPIPSQYLNGSEIVGGSLAVPDSAIVADRTEDWYEAFAASQSASIFASQDWHPPGHCSFCRNGTAQGNPMGYHPHGAICKSGEDVPVSVMNATNRCVDKESLWLWGQDNYFQWPDHCIQGSFGSKFDPFLGIPSTTVVVQKGFNHTLDSYSAFGGLDFTTGADLYKLLTSRNIRRLWVLGVALDFCVQQSALDALGSNPGTGRPAPPTLEHVILVRSATAVSDRFGWCFDGLLMVDVQAVNATAGEIAVEAIQRAGGHVVTEGGVQAAIDQFCSQL